MKQSPTRKFPRTARINESLREVLAETLEGIDDDRLELVTITAVETDPDLRHAVVFYSALTTRHSPEAVGEALAEQRVRLQGAIARQVIMKRTPLLRFEADPSIVTGARIDEVIRSLPPRRELDDEGQPVPGDQA